MQEYAQDTPYLKGIRRGMGEDKATTTKRGKPSYGSKYRQLDVEWLN